MTVIDAMVTFAIAVLSGTGVGGGGLYILYLTVFSALNQADAQCLNLVFFVSSALGAIPVHLLYRNVNLGTVKLFIAFGALGTIFGGIVRGILSLSVLKKIFGIFLILTGAVTLLKNLGSCRHKKIT